MLAFQKWEGHPGNHAHVPKQKKREGRVWEGFWGKGRSQNQHLHLCILSLPACKEASFFL